ncbi:MAG: hypothetical protein ACR2N3_18755 [Pyrinomonadaceae bacterium]
MLRGGFGVFYDLASQGVGQQIRLGTPPFGNENDILGSLFGGPAQFPIPPDQSVPPVIGRNPPFQNLPLFDPNLKQPYTLQYNVAVEQSLGINQTFTASYVGAAGRRLLRQRLISGIVTPAGSAIPLFFNPSLIDNTSTSDYNALQLQFQRRLSRGLQAIASYTWAHSIDTASTGQSSIADARLNFNAGKSIIASREGGGVRFPSGKVIFDLNTDTPMPKVGRIYVFFLKYSDETGFSIITAYELLQGQVFPLDGVTLEGNVVRQYAGHQSFRDAPEADFLNRAKEAIRNNSDVFIGRQ